MHVAKIGQMLIAGGMMLGVPALAQTSISGFASDQTVAPGNASPERDARGIPVISEPATVPEGWNLPARSVPAGTSVLPAVSMMNASGPLPPCSRMITDRCTQTYGRWRVGRGDDCPNPYDPLCPPPEPRRPGG